MGDFCVKIGMEIGVIMKKVLLIMTTLTVIGLTLGGSLAYWLAGKSNPASAETDSANKTVQEDTNLQQKLPEEYHSIAEYKEKFSKDKKYIKNCTGEGSIDYSMFDVNDINAANQAVACYQMKYDKKRGTKEAEKDYLEFVRYGFDFANSHFNDMEKEYSIIVNKGTFNISSVKIIEELLDRYFYKYGLKAVYGELEFYPEVSDLYVYENIAPYLSKEWSVYLESETNFEHHISTFHGYFRITKCELEEILEYYKEFNKELPEFSKERGIPNSIKYYEKALKTYPKVPD